MHDTSVRGWASNAVLAATHNGATGCEILIRQTTTWISSWQTEAVVGAVLVGPHTTTRGVVTVFLDGEKRGRAEGAADSAEALNKLVRTATKNAKVVSGCAGVAPRLDVREGGLGILDRRQAQLEDEQRKAVVEENLQMIRSVRGARPRRIQYTESLTTRTLVSSSGCDVQEQSTRYALSIAVGQEKGSHEVEGEVSSRHFADVASLPLGSDLAQQVMGYVKPAKLTPGPVTVVVEPRVIAKIMAAVVPGFNQAIIDSGKSFLSGTSGERVGAPLLHMIDDAARPGGLETRAFDDRGVPSLDLPIIREGLAGAFYTSVDVALPRGERSSGHEGSAGLWAGNLLLRSGNRSRNMIFPDLGTFVILHELVDTDILNLKTGKLVLRGHLYKGDGSTPQVYAGVHTIETTVTELWSGISEVANDQRRFGCVDCATWVVRGLSVS